MIRYFLCILIFLLSSKIYSQEKEKKKSEIEMGLIYANAFNKKIEKRTASQIYESYVTKMVSNSFSGSFMKCNCEYLPSIGFSNNSVNLFGLNFIVKKEVFKNFYGFTGIQPVFQTREYYTSLDLRKQLFIEHENYKNSISEERKIFYGLNYEMDTVTEKLMFSSIDFNIAIGTQYFFFKNWLVELSSNIQVYYHVFNKTVTSTETKRNSVGYFENRFFMQDSDCELLLGHKFKNGLSVKSGIYYLDTYNFLWSINLTYTI